MDVIKMENNSSDDGRSNLFTAVGCVAGLAAYDISKRFFQPTNSNSGCITRTGYYLIMGSIALTVGQRISKLVNETYHNCKCKKMTKKG